MKPELDKLLVQLNNPRSSPTLITSKISVQDTNSHLEFGPPDILSSEIEYDEMLGTGCFGSVYTGKCRSTPCAIKVLKTQNKLPEKVISDFKKEVLIASRLCHPNIMLFMGCCTEPGNLAIVMEKCAYNLEELLSSKANLSFYRRLSIAVEIATGMEWLHRSNPPIIHRDLKPSNILFDNNFRVKICDFGLSQIKTEATMVDKEKIPGTPLYMAPEVMLGKAIDTSCDVYSYSLVLWQLLTELDLFDDYDNYKIFKRAITVENIRPPIPRHFPPRICELLEAAWNKDPKARPTFAMICTTLQEIMLETSIRDDTGRAFWKKYFQHQEYADFDRFLRKWYSSLGCHNEYALLTKGQIHCLRLLLNVTTNQDGVTEYVSVEKFGELVECFKPMVALSPRNTKLLQQMLRVCKRKYFFGHLTSSDSKSKILSGCTVGNYLVRFSSKPGVFALDFVYFHEDSKSLKVAQRRIERNVNGYFSLCHTQQDGKKIEIVSSSPNQSLHMFIKNVRPILNLTKAAPGSPFIAAFSRMKGGYDDTDD